MTVQTIDLLHDKMGYIPPPRIKGGSVLYLDFDGVLHSPSVYWSRKQGIHFGPEALAHSQETGHVHRLFEHAPLLQELLQPYPMVRIVLSTSWAKSGYLTAVKRLPPDLQKRCIGATFHRGMDRYLFAQLPRGLQVMSDVARRQPNQWLAIDDDFTDWPITSRHLLVCTDQHLGIAAPKVRAELQAKLLSVFGNSADAHHTLRSEEHDS